MSEVSIDARASIQGSSGAQKSVRRVVRRHVAPEVTAAKLREVTELARRMSRARLGYLRDYWHPRFASQVLRADRGLIEARRHDGWSDVQISPHQHKVSLESALGILRAGWRSTIAVARQRVALRAELTEAERHWCYSALLRPSLLQACLDRRSPRIDARWARDVDSTRCARLLRTLVLRSRAQPPKSSARLWFDVDTNLYRAYQRPEDHFFQGAWVALTGLTPGRRIALPLRGADIDAFRSRTGRPESRPSLRIHVIGGRIVMLTAEIVTVASRSGGASIGLDKGLSRLITVSAGDPLTAQSYGTEFYPALRAIVDKATDRDRARGRLRAYERSRRATATQTARRIRRNNLRSRRVTRARERDRATLRDSVNRALNAFFADHPRVSSIAVESLDVRRQHFSRRLNRHIGRWISGYLHQRIAYKAELNGVELRVVSAAYSSQCCPRCWFTSRLNRMGEQFRCGQCAFTGSADAIAATNLLRRGSDSAITRYTPRSDVYRILEARWRAARIGRAWGSNDGVPEPAWVREHTPERAANNRRRRRPLAGPYGGALSRRQPAEESDSQDSLASYLST